MSTTTIYEVSDTPMLDYAADADFSMEVGHSPQWLPVEATMSDDQILSATDYSEPIEVDMDTNEHEEITEYEMADGDGEFDVDGDAELADVEVVDLSRLASPLIVSAVPSPHPVGNIFSEHTSVPSDSLPPPIMFHPSASPVSPLEQGYVQPVAVEATPSHASFLDHTADDGLQPLPDSHGIAQDAEYPSIHVEAPQDVADSAASAQELFPVPSAESDASLQQPAGPSVEYPHPEPSSHAEEVPQSPARVQELTADGVLSAEASEPQPVGEVHNEVNEDSADDPHEISDGVYIDPPPAVLLTLSSSAGLVDCSLFNQPYSASRSQSPNAYASTSSAGALSLLLSQRPTLYYEPLTDVFNALREEQAIYSHNDLVEGELVLEAFDLDLRVSEDNIYAREVTLHELNIVHDGIDLSGPLRLRLSAGPRFITRFHALREQISQLSLGVEAEHLIQDGSPEQPEHVGTHADVTHSEHQNGLSNEAVEAASDSSDAQQEVEQATSEEQLAEEQDADVHADNQEVATTEAVDRSGQDEQEDTPEDCLVEAADDSVTRVPESTTEYGTEVTTEEAAEQLDADEAHRFADAEDGGDYTEYAEDVEDDDEAYGEALPEELGGTGDGVNPQHEESVGDDADTSNDQEDAEGVDDEDEDEDESDTAADSEPKESAVVDPATADDVETASAVAGGPVPDETSTDIVDEVPVQEPGVSGADPDLTAELEDFDNFEDYEDDDADDTSQYNAETNENETQLELPYDDVIHDASSKYSSETLSSHSKRSRDEDEDEEEGALYESPDAKRVKTH